MNVIIHSGGAIGADRLFMMLATIYKFEYKGYYYGEKSQHNAPYGNIKISEEEYNEGRVMATLAAKHNYGYNFKSYIKDPRLCRNWMQVKNSDMIIAVSRIANKGEKLFKDERVALNPCVTGGTGYAVTMAMLHKKPVYVFNMNINQWCTFDYETNEWILCDEPKLSNNFAGIGSRELTTESIEAIKQLFINNFGEPK